MSINSNRPELWKKDIAESVDYYNNWFIQHAPDVYKESRIQASKSVRNVFDLTCSLEDITPEILRKHPESLPVLRMSTCPPVARDRLIGLAQVSKNLVNSMEKVDAPSIPKKMNKDEVQDNLEKICKVLSELLDYDIFPWVKLSGVPSEEEQERALLIVADRLCGALSNPIIRNSQEQRQLLLIKEWLESRGYRYIDSNEIDNQHPVPGTFTFRHNIKVFVGEMFGVEKEVNIPVDVYIIKKNHKKGDCPILIEAKSAGDFTNVNKRRKEEAQKMGSLKRLYGSKIHYLLFLSGYFDTGYLGYEAAEGIDWIWEHRISDLEKVGL